MTEITMPTVRLTDRSAAALVLPADKTDDVFWDVELPGFGCRVRSGGKRVARSWLAQYRANGQQRRESLGDIRRVKIEDGRRAARKIFAKLELGIDPAAEKVKARIAAAAASLTVGAVADRYLAAKQSTLRPNTFAQAVSYLTDHWQPFRVRPLDSIERKHVAARVQELVQTRGPIAAARARGQLSALYSWAMGEGLVEHNPIIGTNAPDKGIKSRDRVLSEDELKAIWSACRDDDFSRIVQLLMLTACRRDEIGDLEFSEIDFDTGMLVIPGRRIKNGRELRLKLPTIALDILRTVRRRDGCAHLFGTPGKGFTSWSNGMKLFLARMTDAGTRLPHWTLHDLRRSTATHMVDDEIGIQPHIVEALLNHVSGHKRGVAGIYNRASHPREIARALEMWADHLTALVQGGKKKVVRLPRRA
jgi:integrase